MASIDDLAPIAAKSAFIFTGSIAQTGAPTAPVPSGDATTAAVSVEHVIKAPIGLRGLAGREVTAQLLHPLAPGHYLFFADPLSVGASIAVKERAHFDAEEREVAEAAVERGYAARMRPVWGRRSWWRWGPKEKSGRSSRPPSGGAGRPGRWPALRSSEC